MVVNSVPFLVFFLVVFALYYLFSKSCKAQQWVMLLASYFFYGFADARMLWLLVGATIVFYSLGVGIANAGNDKTKNVLTATGVILGVALLLYFKYLNFFVESFSYLLEIIGLHTNWETFKIIMPLGISFFTFKLISYIVDIRQGTVPVEKDFVSFAAYISFFPTILSGPIDRACNFLPQMKQAKCFDYTLAVEGCRQILWGMFKKMVVADGLSLFIQRDLDTSNGATLAIVAIFYSIQLYADFSGYSDMAIGVGKLLGYRIAPNFRYPYFSQNIAEFWRRWHMSLLTWFRYYLYIPLGGSRCSHGKVIRNTFIVFLVSGLWHGANWTFVCWGLFHAMLFMPTLLLGRKAAKHPFDEKQPLTIRRIFSMLTVFVLVTIAWVIFRMDSISQFFQYMDKVFSMSFFAKPEGVMWAMPAFLASLFMFGIEWYHRNLEFPLLHLPTSKVARWSMYLLLVVAIVFYQGKPTEFIYFKF